MAVLLGAILGTLGFLFPELLWFYHQWKRWAPREDLYSVVIFFSLSPRPKTVSNLICAALTKFTHRWWEAHWAQWYHAFWAAIHFLDGFLQTEPSAQHHQWAGGASSLDTYQAIYLTRAPGYVLFLLVSAVELQLGHKQLSFSIAAGLGAD